ncbi:VENN motif pre-toxin domain-containing protein [Neisseria sp. SLRRB23]|uniref:VENN motif pre-toxin domain-containing protein n=1 Tax=Neisseria sp. SLRRB23 TaxID=3435199 RepID=UPI003D7FCEAA
MLAHSPAYAQAYQEARSWGIGGSKSRALTAAETLITGALGGQGDLQLAANTLAPYAAAAIGKRFGHGENKNEAAQAIGHFMLGAALAYANGTDPLAGGSAAVAAERAAEYLAKQYDDGRTAIDPISGKFNPNLLPEHIKEEIKAQTGALASVVGAAGGSLNGTNSGNGALFDAQVGGVLGQNAVENNQLDTQQMNAFIDGMNLHCKTGNESACEAVKRTFTLLDKNQREKLQDTCNRYPRTKVCADLIGKAQEGDALIVDQFNTQKYDILGNKMMMGIFPPEDICNNPTCVTEIKKQDARNIKDKNYLVRVLGSQDAKNIRKGNRYTIT